MVIAKAFRHLPLLAALALTPGLAGAQDYRAGAIRIDHPWAVATPGGAKVGAGYMTLTNQGSEPDRLIGLASPIAGKVTLHESVVEGDVAKMRPLAKGLEIKPGETVELKPGGLHVMFEGLREPLKEAARVKGTLVFEKAGSVEVDYAVTPMGTRDPHPKAHGH